VPIPARCAPGARWRIGGRPDRAERGPDRATGADACPTPPTGIAERGRPRTARAQGVEDTGASRMIGIVRVVARAYRS
jgi:hypothetical protein